MAFYRNKFMQWVLTKTFCSQTKCRITELQSVLFYGLSISPVYRFQDKIWRTLIYSIITYCKLPWWCHLMFHWLDLSSSVYNINNYNNYKIYLLNNEQFFHSYILCIFMMFIVNAKVCWRKNIVCFYSWIICRWISTWIILPWSILDAVPKYI